MSDGVVTVSDVELGKYAGRVLGSVSVDGKDLVEALISAGHGRAYDGGARESWCEVRCCRGSGGGNGGTRLLTNIKNKALYLLQCAH